MYDSSLPMCYVNAWGGFVSDPIEHWNVSAVHDLIKNRGLSSTLLALAHFGNVCWMLPHTCQSGIFKRSEGRKNAVARSTSDSRTYTWNKTKQEHKQISTCDSMQRRKTSHKYQCKIKHVSCCLAFPRSLASFSHEQEYVKGDSTKQTGKTNTSKHSP